MKRYLSKGMVLFIITILVLALPGKALAADYIERISVAYDGSEGDNMSLRPTLSGDGRYAAFEAYANNLVPNDTNPGSDIILYDRSAGTIELLSVNSDEVQANHGDSCNPIISADGRYVAFESNATNLVPDDTNDLYDIFVRDRQDGVTERASVNSDEEQTIGGDSCHAAISGDGRYVGFDSYATNLVSDDNNGNYDVFIRDRQNGTTIRVSTAAGGGDSNGLSYLPVISANGRYVAFTSNASNLVPGDTNGRYDMFVYDLVAGTTERVSVASDGSEGSNDSHSEAAFSADGRYVAFGSYASNLVAGDTNNAADIFIRDRVSGTTERVSVASDGTQGSSYSREPTISADGRYVAFQSYASNLAAGDTNNAADIFIHDRDTGTTTRVSVDGGGAQANGDSYHPYLSADGGIVAFFSYASNLVPGDTNGKADVFVIDLNAPPAAADDNYEVRQDQVLTVPAKGVLANDNNPTGKTLSAIKASDPANGTVTLNADGSFTYTPNAGYEGTDSFTYYANDGAFDSNTATVTISVTPNAAPVAADDSYTAGQGKVLSVPSSGVLANDTDAENDPLTAVKASDPVNGTVTLNADGSFTYTPNAGYEGTDSFTYYANDGTSDSNTATVTISVTPNTAPVAADDSYTAIQNQPLIVPAKGVLVNDTDAENDPLYALLDSDPANGKVKLQEDGSFTYIPLDGFMGEDSFTYAANDDVFDSNIATVTINVVITDQPANGPTGLSPADGAPVKAGKTSVTLKWKPPDGKKSKDVRQYQLQVATSPDLGGALLVNKAIKSAKFTLKNLLPNTQYYWQVSAVLKASPRSAGTWSGASSFYTPLTAPPKLTAPKNNALQKKATIKLAWKRPTGAPKTTAFVLQYGTDPAFGEGTFSEVSGIRAAKYVIGDLGINAPPATYYWRVKATSADGSTEYSDWSTARAFRR